MAWQQDILSRFRVKLGNAMNEIHVSILKASRRAMTSSTSQMRLKWAAHRDDGSDSDGMLLVSFFSHYYISFRRLFLFSTATTMYSRDFFFVDVTSSYPAGFL